MQYLMLALVALSLVSCTAMPSAAALSALVPATGGGIHVNIEAFTQTYNYGTRTCLCPKTK